MFVYFNEAFVFGGFDLGFIILLLLFLLGPLRFVFKSSLLASLLDLGCFVQDLLHAVFFGFEIILTLCRYFLLSQHLVVLKTLSKLCDRHLIKEAIPSGLSRIESLGADDGHAFKFTYLSDEFFLLFLFDLVLLLAPLHGLTELLVDLVSDLPFLLLQLLHLPHGVVLLGEHSFDYVLLLLPVLLHLLVLLGKLDLHLGLDLRDKHLVLLLLVLLGLHGGLTGQLHLYLLLLYVF